MFRDPPCVDVDDDDVMGRMEKVPRKKSERLALSLASRDGTYKECFASSYRLV